MINRLKEDLTLEYTDRLVAILQGCNNYAVQTEPSLNFPSLFIRAEVSFEVLPIFTVTVLVNQESFRFEVFNNKIIRMGVCPYSLDTILVFLEEARAK